MTDIVERLRGHPGKAMTVTEQFRNMVEQRHEAADEIERLRMTLKDIECRSIDHTEACRMAGEARRALEPKP